MTPRPPGPNIHQRIGLVLEAQVAAGLLRAGLVALEEINGANNFYRVPMMLIGQGLERLMKVAIALVSLEDTGSLPSVATIKGYGHDLARLLDDCATIAARPTYQGRPAARDDATFLATDPDLRALVDAIAGYGDAERYAELGRFLGDPRATSQDPDARLAAIERTILDRHPEWTARLAGPEFRGFYPVLVAELTATVQRLARAVSRFLVWGPAGDLGRQASAELTPLLVLRDDALATRPRRWRRS